MFEPLGRERTNLGYKSADWLQDGMQRYMYEKMGGHNFSSVRVRARVRESLPGGGYMCKF